MNVSLLHSQGSTARHGRGHRRGHVLQLCLHLPKPLCEDGHDSCAPLSDKQTQQDTFLSNNLSIYLGSSAYQQNGVVFITWDENDSTTGTSPSQIMTVTPLPDAGQPRQHQHDQVLALLGLGHH